MAKYDDGTYSEGMAYKSCPYCSYDRNPQSSEFCESCGRQIPGRSIRFIPATLVKNAPKHQSVQLIRFLILTLAVAAIVILKPWQWLKFPSQASSPSIVHNTQSKVEIRQYDTMAQVLNVPEGTFRYGNALPFAALNASGINDRITQAHPKFHLEYTDSGDKKPGSGTAIAMLINREVSFAQSVRPISDAENAEAKSRGVSIKQVAIGIDGLIFYVHPDLLVPGLSIAQIRDIFLGKITNWSQVGGPDLKIVPFSLDPTATGTLKVMLGIDIKAISSRVRFVRDYTSGIRSVAMTPGAISYASAPGVVGQKLVQTLGIAKSSNDQFIFPLEENGKINVEAFKDGSYPLTRRLFVMIHQDNKLDEQAGVAYINLLLSLEGQKMIEKVGFSPIR